MKEKFKGKIISGFVGLKSQMYCLIAVDGGEIKKAKGVNKYVVKNIMHKKMIRYKMKRIQRKQYRIATYNVCKISLSCFDNKRYILGDSINSLAYFNKDIRNQ